MPFDMRVAGLRGPPAAVGRVQVRPPLVRACGLRGPPPVLLAQGRHGAPLLRTLPTTGTCVTQKIDIVPALFIEKSARFRLFDSFVIVAPVHQHLINLPCVNCQLKCRTSVLNLRPLPL